MLELFKLVATEIRWSDALATIALLISVATFITNRRHTRRTRAIQTEEKRTLVLLSLDHDIDRLRLWADRVDGIGTLLESNPNLGKLLADQLGPRHADFWETFPRGVRSLIDEGKKLRDAIKGEASLDEVRLQAMVPDLERRARQSEALAADAEQLYDRLERVRQTYLGTERH